MNEPEPFGPDPEPWAAIARSVPGWFLFSVAHEDDDIELYVRAVIGPSGWPVITGIALDGPHLSARNLRDIPLARIEAALRTPRLLDWVKKVGPDGDPLRILQDVTDEGPENFYRQASHRARLQRPDGADPTSFYSQVAAAYRHYVTFSNKPAVEIANEAGVPPATARRWINRARELGLLEKGQRGRAI